MIHAYRTRTPPPGPPCTSPAAPHPRARPTPQPTAPPSRSTRRPRARVHTISAPATRSGPPPRAPCRARRSAGSRGAAGQPTSCPCMRSATPCGRAALAEYRPPRVGPAFLRAAQVGNEEGVVPLEAFLAGLDALDLRRQGCPRDGREIHHAAIVALVEPGSSVVVPAPKSTWRRSSVSLAPRSACSSRTCRRPRPRP